MKVSKERSEVSPRSRQHSGEVHLSDQDKVPGTQHTVKSLQLLVQEVKPRLQYKLFLQKRRDNLVLLNLKFIFLHQPVDDKAKQEDQSEEWSHGDDGQNDGEQFEVQSWDLERQVVSVGLPDVPEQN